MPQDLSHKKLRNQSLAHQNLEEANFTASELQGADFKSANLTKVNFTSIKAGISKPRKSQLALFTILLAVLSGFIATYAGHVLGNLFTKTEPVSTLIAWLVAATLLGLGYIIFRKGFTYQLGSTSLFVATMIVAMVSAITNDEKYIDILAQITISSLAFGGAIASTVSLATTFYISRVKSFSLGCAILGMALCAGINVLEDYSATNFLSLVLVSIAIPALAHYISSKASQSDARYQLIHSLAINLLTSGGTSFANADLTNANFAHADLIHTDFRGANLTRTNWRNAKNLDRANLERTYLENPTIRNLLTSSNGHNQDLQKLDLSNLNLDNANLSGADLRNANLNNSTLRNANLSRAKLVQAQLYGADLTGANLTGAFIQNWGISPETIFDDVQCDYIHMRLPTDQDPDPCRKPDNKSETFRPGDFADFIAPIIRTLDSYQQQNLDPRTLLAPKTLDLYHYEGIDPSAAAIALQQLIETNPQDQIEVRAIEGRGYQKVRIQAQVANSADPSQLNADYFDRYNDLKILAYPDLQNLLNGIEAKDSRIRGLETMMMNALGSDRFYAETQRPNVATVLLLAANPKNTTRLRLDEEFQQIQAGLERARHRELFILQQRLAISPHVLRRALLDLRPRIVHFSGHGEGSQQTGSSANLSPEGLVLEDEQGQARLVSGQALADLFAIFIEDIDCVVLNACYSETQANAIAQHIPYVIGMSRAISDRAAIEFSIGFYDGLLAGQPIETAYRLGCNAIQLQGIPEHLTPILKRKVAG